MINWGTTWGNAHRIGLITTEKVSTKMSNEETTNWPWTPRVQTRKIKKDISDWKSAERWSAKNWPSEELWNHVEEYAVEKWISFYIRVKLKEVSWIYEILRTEADRREYCFVMTESVRDRNSWADIRSWNNSPRDFHVQLIIKKPWQQCSPVSSLSEITSRAHPPHRKWDVNWRRTIVSRMPWTSRCGPGCEQFAGIRSVTEGLRLPKSDCFCDRENKPDSGEFEQEIYPN